MLFEHCSHLAANEGVYLTIRALLSELQHHPETEGTCTND